MKQPLSKLVLWDRNYRVGDVEAIKASIRRFGFNAAVRVRTSEDGSLVVYAGNHSVKALREIFEEDGFNAMPTNITPDFSVSDWMVEAITLDHLPIEEATAFAIADNRTAELGQVNEEQLEQLLRELAEFDSSLILATGYDLTNFLPEVTEEQSEATGSEFVDRAEELQEKWQVTRGDVYQLGAHRLMCGDSESNDDLEALWPKSHRHKGRIERPLLMVTDPPYGVQYDSSWRAEFSGGNYASGTIANDDRADWTDVWSLWNPQIMYVWHGGLHAGVVSNSLEQAGYEIRAQIIWNKSSMVFSRGAYHWKHEPCWYAVQKGSNANWQGDRTQTTVWDCGNGSACAQTEDESDKFHAGHISQKPVDLFRRAILNHSEPGDLVVDPFAGSGSCIVACELTKRICFSMELEPKFVAAILERCSQLGIEVKKL